MRNEVYQDRPADAEFFPCPSTVKAGDAVLVGHRPAVALDDYSTRTLGTVFRFSGSFTLTVIGQTSASPQTSAALKPGAKIFAVGTLDSGTNITTGLTLDGTSTGTLFGTLGNYTVSSGATDTAALVKLAGAPE